MRKALMIFAFLSFALSCVQRGKVEIEGLDQVPKSAGSIQSTMTSVSVVNDQLVINGTGFSNVSQVRVKGPSGFDENFSIESKTDSNIVANGKSMVSFAMDTIYKLVLSNAHAAATYEVTFSLNDGEVKANHLHDMGAGDGDVLIYNQSLSEWEPSPLSGITYRGSWDASSNAPSLADGGGNTSPMAGDFYVVSTSGSTDIDGETTWNAGDWIIFDAVNGVWDRVANTSSVTDVFGRQGAVMAQEGDYNIDQLGDVTISGTPSTGQVLEWSGSEWAPATDDSGTASNSIDTSHIINGEILDEDISASAGIAQSKINNLTTDLADKLPLDGSSAMTGSLDMGTNAITNVGNVDGVDVSALETQVTTNSSDIAGKADQPGSNCGSGKKLQWDGTSFTCVSDMNTNAETLCNAGEYLDGDGSCVTASTGNGDFMADGSVPMTGDLDFGFNKARLKSDNSNYAELIAPTSLSATYTLTLPSNAGSGGNVLTTDGSGNLSWASSGDGSVTTVTGSAPIASSGGNSPNISISQAGTSNDGYLSSSDWNTFNDKQDAITTGSTSEYLRGDLSLGTFSADVAGSILSGYVMGSDSTVTNTDTVETAVEKLQGQLNANDTAIAGKQEDLSAPSDGTKYLDGNETWQTLDTSAVTENGNLYFTETRVFDSLLSGYTTGSDSALADGDTLLTALAKLEGQIQADASNAFLKDGSVAMTGAFDGGGNDLTNIGSLTTSNQAGITVGSYGSAAGETGELRFNDLDDTNYVGFKAPDAVSSNLVWRLPASDGANGEALVTDNSGNLSWASSLPPSGSAGGDLSGSYPDPDIGSGVIVDGDVNASANIAASKLGTGLVSNTEFNYLDGVSSSIQTQLNGKESALGTGTAGQYLDENKTWQNLDTDAVTEGTNLYFTDSRAQGAVVEDTIIDGTTNKAPSENAVFDALADKLSLTGGTLTGPLNIPANDLTVGTDQIVTSSGNVGVGTSTPVAKLDVSGGVKLGNSSVTCDASHKGTMRLNGDNLEICTGSTPEWMGVGSHSSPIGTIIPYGGGTIPAGYFECDGSAISRTTYSELFNALGTAWGAGDGSTTFNIPDLRGRFIRGQDKGAGRDPAAGSRTACNSGGNTGDSVGSCQGDQLSSHSHGVNPPSAGTTTAGNHNHSYTDPLNGGSYIGLQYDGNGTAAEYPVSNGGTTGSSGSHTHSIDIGNFNSANTGGGENRPKNANVKYIVKYAHVSVDSSGIPANDSVGSSQIIDGTISASDLDTDYVDVSGDTMTGTLNLPSNGFDVGSGQLTASSGNVGVGTSSPSEKLEVNGNAKITGSVEFGGRTHKRTTYCKVTSGPPSYSGNSCWHYWSASDCDNGAPQGSCLGFISKTTHSGDDEDWQVLLPGESAGGGTATNGGMSWWNGSGCGNSSLTIAAVYMCDQ